MADHDAFHAKVLDEFSVLRTEHAVLRNITESTLAQAIKTNGRVSKTEERLDSHDIAFAVAASKKASTDWWKEKLGGAIIALIVGAMGFALSLVLQKTNVIDVSAVSAEQYDAISNSLSE